MAKKIKDFFYKSNDNAFAVQIDYNNLCYYHHSFQNTERRLLGAVNDRIEAYFIRKKYIKITEKEFNILLEQFKIN